MKYFFELSEMPNEYKRWILVQKKRVDQFVESRKKKELNKLENEYLEKWNHWKERIDTLSTIRKPNITEEIIKSRFELTKYHELLSYVHDKSPHKKESKL